MPTEDLLRMHISDVEIYEDLDAMQTHILNRSCTAKLWVDCFVRPTLITMFFIRAEADREWDWPLHLWAVSEMVSYLFASSHVTYAIGMVCSTSVQGNPFQHKFGDCFCMVSTH